MHIQYLMVIAQESQEGTKDSTRGGKNTDQNKRKQETETWARDENDIG